MSENKPSFLYGKEYQERQAEKYRNRENNHWKIRISLAKRLVDYYVKPRIGKPKSETVVVDVGCSIGTFAIEFSKYGYKSYGIDFDSTALEIARKLAQEENVHPEFICGDVSDWTYSFPDIDIAICFDIFEHLPDDELGSFLNGIKKQLSKNGRLVFSTFPTQFNYIFFSKYRYPLMLFKWLSSSKFNVIVKVYSCLLDIMCLFRRGMNYKEVIKRSCHCNPNYY